MNLQKAIYIYQAYGNPGDERSLLGRVDGRAFWIVTIGYLVALLSVPLEYPERLIWYAFYPILFSPAAGLSYSSVFRKSLYVLPFVAFIGIFNPLFDTREAIKIGEWAVSMGWITFISILLRGLLAMQALVIFIHAMGFLKICRSLRQLGIPKVLTIQLFLLYRFMGVLMEEAFTLKRATASRGYGKKSLSLKLWVRIIGSLLLRTIDRSKRLHRAMMSRGFTGDFNMGKIQDKWQMRDSLFCVGCLGAFAWLHFYDMSHFFTELTLL